MPGLADDGVGAFVLEAPERGSFARHGGGIVRIDFHHPAEAQRFVRLVRQVEARILEVPAVEAVLAQREAPIGVVAARRRPCARNVRPPAK